MPEYRDRISTLAERARRDREQFEPPEKVPAPDRAMEFLRNGVGPVTVLYIQARTRSEGPVPFTEAELSLLERALNDWLELYAACYDADLDAAFTVREAAELLVQTHNVRDVAQLLTHVPSRRAADD